jgi:hypothetical protein
VLVYFEGIDTRSRNSLKEYSLLAITQMIEADKLQVKELRSQGYSDGQLQEMGFPKISLGLAPAVLKS